jgi:hypothetical protein
MMEGRESKLLSERNKIDSAGALRGKLDGRSEMLLLDAFNRVREGKRQLLLLALLLLVKISSRVADVKL